MEHDDERSWIARAKATSRTTTSDTTGHHVSAPAPAPTLYLPPLALDGSAGQDLDVSTNRGMGCGPTADDRRGLVADVDDDSAELPIISSREASRWAVSGAAGASNADDNAADTLADALLGGLVIHTPHGADAPHAWLTDPLAAAVRAHRTAAGLTADTGNKTLRGDRANGTPRGRRARRSRTTLPIAGVAFLLALLCGTLLLRLAGAAFAALPASTAGHPATTATVPSFDPASFSLPALSLPTPTAPSPLPSPTATLPPLPNFALPPFCSDPALTPTPQTSPTPGATPTSIPGCVSCPYVYDPTTYSTSQVQQALDTAADAYHLPHALVEGIAWLESGWTRNAGLITCHYDAGIMQIKQGYMEWIDQLQDANCGLSYSPDDPYSLAGNALMGAKLIAFILCYYGWRAGVGGTLADPAPETSDWYYQNAGLPWPDTLGANGAPNPKSLCAAAAADATRVDPGNPQNPTTWAQVYHALPVADEPWSCPFSAQASDHTLLQIVVSAYNEGTGTMDSQGIVNWWYVTRVATYIAEFGTGALPPNA